MVHSQTGIGQRIPGRSVADGLSRRQFLQSATATTAALVIAGCLGDDDEPEEETTPGVPGSFEDREQLRSRAREYIQLLADGEYGTAYEWLDEQAANQTAQGGIEQVWTGTVGEDAEIDSFETVSFFGNEMGINQYLIRARIGGDRYQFLVGFREDGVAIFAPTPIGKWTPPEYVDEDSFVEEELSLDTPLDCELGATLTVPDTEGKVPGVVIVHGNGPSGRNGIAGPNRTYKELAWGLASEGVAVLRYDKRSYACEPDFADATIDDIVTDDALTAISALRDHDSVADDRVYVAGHSFGGALAPRIARQDGNLAGVVMLAPGPAESFPDLVVRQTEHLLDLGSALVSESQRQEQLETVREEAEKMRTLDIGDDEVVRFGGREFHRSLQEYDQTATAANLDIPLLLIQGGQDWQVTVENDLPIWRDALEEKRNATIEVYDNLNHLFQRSSGRRTRAEYLKDRAVDERVIDTIATFVVADVEQPPARIPVVGG